MMFIILYCPVYHLYHTELQGLINGDNKKCKLYTQSLKQIEIFLH